MVRRVTLALALLAATPLAGAGSNGLSRATARRVDALFADWSGPARPGCAVGVVRAGELVLARGYGLADLEHGAPIDRQTLFDLGSVSKQFTAAAIVLLALEGRLDLDDDVRRHLPELPDHGTPVTLRHLLHHRGGLREYTTLMSLAGDDDADRTTAVEALATLVRQRGADFPAGERYEYSNTGYFLLGQVVERVAGEPLARFAARRFFAPLAMSATHFRDDHTRIVPGRAVGYARRGEGFGVAMSDWEQVGDGSLLTSLADLARWIDNLERGTVGGPRFVELMAARGLPTDPQAAETYGFGNRVGTWRGRPALRHGGSWAGYRAHLLHLPEQALAVAALCNFAEADDLGARAEAVAALALGEAPDPPAAPSAAATAAPAPAEAPAVPAARLERYAGRYWSEEVGTGWEVRLDGGRALLVGRDAVGRPLRPDPEGAEDVLLAEGGLRLRFARGADGAAEGFELEVDSMRGLGFRRVEEPARGFVVVDALLVDGTGAPARRGGVRVVGDRIAEVGAVVPRPGETVVDAAGLVLAPGFVDTHSHADSDLGRLPEAIGAVSQGITTVVGGADGDSVFPLAELFARREREPAAVNVASYSGHGTLRALALGEDFRRVAAPAEVAVMTRLLERDLDAGALGLSTGLEYDPGIYSATGEVIALARAAARRGGRYASHVRSEDRHFWEAIEEILRIGREAALPVHVSHLKLAMRSHWGQAPRLLARFEEARRQGIDVTADIYPYLYWHSTLTVLFPERDFGDLAEARRVLAEIAPADGLLLGRYLPEPRYAGRTLAAIAAERGEAPEVTLLALIRDAETMRRLGAEEVESVIGTSMTESDLEALLVWPHTNACTDGELDGRHPRGFGAYPRLLGRYVRERGVLGLEEAIRRMTSLAADHAGIADRGRLAPGAWADLVLLDPATVADRATTEDPHAVAVGIERVWVNGRTVWAGGEPSGLRPGRVLRRAAPRPPPGEASR
jgi:N-acyl-D-amino-acid deacylase